MTTITKAGLARELGVSKARVSQYVGRGLPVLPSGKIDREAAVKWIAANHLDRGLGDAPGVKRAGDLARAVKPKPAAKPKARAAEPGPFAHALMDACAEMVGHSGPVAAAVAIELGLPVRMAYALDRLAAIRMSEVAETYLSRRAIAPAEYGGDILEWMGLTVPEADWPALAAKAGEPVDQDAWDEFLESIPSLWPDKPLAA